MLSDTPALRSLLLNLLPGLTISATPRPSGQRVVFFCRFEPRAVGKTEPRQRATWGEVVLKASEGIHPAQIAYLQKEIDILNSLHSKHYPKLHWNETFTEDPTTGDKLPHRLFVTIEERIAAEPLSALTARYCTEANVLKLLDGLVDALMPLWNHPQRLVHRDIKPDNILIRSDGTVAIIDLGILREEGSPGLTATGHPFGPCTPLYASPEQARNDKRNISFKSDFFSIGVVAYELIAGEHPFGALTDPVIDILDRVQIHTPATLAERKVASKAFSAFVAKLMEKYPYRRHRTPAQLQEDLCSLQHPS
jgi:serine/threonine protein kinase